MINKLHTITKECNTATVPSAEHLLLQHDLGDTVLGSSVDEVSEGMNLTVFATRHLKVANLVAHGLGSLGPQSERR